MLTRLRLSEDQQSAVIGFVVVGVFATGIVTILVVIALGTYHLARIAAGLV